MYICASQSPTSSHSFPLGYPYKRGSENEVNQEGKKQVSAIITYMWNLENGIDILFCKAEIETQAPDSKHMDTILFLKGSGLWFIIHYIMIAWTIMFIQIFPTEAMENLSELFDQSNISLTMHNIFLKWLKRSASGLCLWQETRKVSL